MHVLSKNMVILARTPIPDLSSKYVIPSAYNSGTLLH